MPPPFDALNPYSRNQGCSMELVSCVTGLQMNIIFRFSICPANDDGVIDVIHSLKTNNGVAYNLYDTRIEDDSIYFDFSQSTDNYLTSSISSGDGYSLKMIVDDGNIDGYGLIYF